MANSPGFQPRDSKRIPIPESRRDDGATRYGIAVAPPGLDNKNDRFPGVETPG